MKKLLFTLILFAGTYISKAQTPVVTIYNMTSYALGTYIVANDSPTPICTITGGAGLFSIAPGGSTINVATIPIPAWKPPTPTPATNLVECHLDIDLGGGVHVGAPPVSLCSGSATGVPITFGGSIALTYDITDFGTYYEIKVY